MEKKDDTIQRLTYLLELEKSSKKKTRTALPKLSSVYVKTTHATNKHSNVTASRDFILQKLEGIPKITKDNYAPVEFFVGSGVFGCVKLGYLKSLEFVIAVKHFDQKTSYKSILAETVILLTLSWSRFVPFCYWKVLTGS